MAEKNKQRSSQETTDEIDSDWPTDVASESEAPPGASSKASSSKEKASASAQPRAKHKRKAKQAQATGRKQAPADEQTEPDTEDDLLPDWAPWAVLIGLLAIGLLGGLGVFSTPAPEHSAADVTASADEGNEGDEGDEGSSDRRAEQGDTNSAKAERPKSKAADQETVEASHLLVQYKGSMRARPNITRTKEEAKKRAAEALAKAKKADDFGKVVAEYSDEPGAAQRQGKLGAFTRRRMVKPFSDAAFALKPGEISDIVETPFGFHVIKRTK